MENGTDFGRDWARRNNWLAFGLVYDDDGGGGDFDVDGLDGSGGLFSSSFRCLDRKMDNWKSDAALSCGTAWTSSCCSVKSY